MTLLTINALIVTLFFTCITSLSPINLGVLVLIIALVISCTLAAVVPSWFGFIIFIIYVGGMLVMFAYFAALQPNQHITRWRWLIAPTFFIVLITTLNKNQTIIWSSHPPNTIEIYSATNIAIPPLLALILFLALIIVVKTARTDRGPLRPFNYV